MDALVFFILHLALCIPLGSTFLIVGTPKNDVREEPSDPSNTLIKMMNHNMEDKLDQVGKKMSNVDRNVETLKQEFEMLAENEKYVEQKLDTLDSEVKLKLSAATGAASGTLGGVQEQLRALEPFTDIERRLDKVEVGMGDKLTTEIFLMFNFLWVPLVTFASLWLKPVIAMAVG